MSASMGVPVDPEFFDLLKGQTRVSGIGPAGGFAYALDLSVPSITCAIHAGHRVRRALLARMTLSETDRLAEEDAATDQIIGKCPSILWGRDSRAEYDLNRPKGSAMPVSPEMFWGMPVYHPLPTAAMRQRSRMKHETFYRFVGTVIRILLERFGGCVVYDIHSYNRHRQIENGHPAPPVFNLGTRCIDRNRWKAPVQEWLAALRGIPIPGWRTTVAENDVFGGKGTFCRTLTQWDPRILVLPTEILKIYMDEKSGRLDLHMIHRLRTGLAQAVLRHLEFFRNAFCQE